MGILANLLVGGGAVLGLFGLLFAAVPLVSIPLFAIGGGMYWLGRTLQREARKRTVRRQLGG